VASSGVMELEPRRNGAGPFGVGVKDQSVGTLGLLKVRLNLSMLLCLSSAGGFRAWEVRADFAGDVALEHRMISRLLRPSVVRRSTQARVGS
jgi:hypothetical protein